jgi:hypothetical protein
LQALDIVFAKICTALDLDEDQLLASDVFDPMSGADGHIHDSSGWDVNQVAIESDSGSTCHDHPVFRPVLMRLVAQSFLRKNLDTFDFVVCRFVKNGETAPGPVLVHHENEGTIVVKSPATYMLDWQMRR